MKLKNFVVCALAAMLIGGGMFATTEALAASHSTKSTMHSKKHAKKSKKHSKKCKKNCKASKK
ncbi:hypothetical protein [Candidiatus Paracoxiella cheracis]|uniref:hypothetical protein n=1 Tax=Candidiatus Paracoxiella cheracis TaxID=3405120 RepID=UPI003BF5D02D